MIEDDAEVIVLAARKAALLDELHQVEAKLGEMGKAPRHVLTGVAMAKWRSERRSLVGQKNDLLARYRKAKSELIHRRNELRQAERDVERELSTPESLIRALLRIAIEYGAYASPKHKDVIQRASCWLGE